MTEETNTQQVEIRDYAIDEYVPMEARYYGAKEMTSTWICANANPTTWYMGTILGALGLGDALLSAIIGNPLVYLILALVGIIGYKVASTNMGLCRVSFGIAGSKLPSFINALQFVGWCGVNTYIAATPLATLLCSIFGGDPHSPIMLIISVFIILLITTFVSVYGAKYIGKAQIVAVVCLAILSVWIGIRIFSLVSFSDIWKWSITDNPANSGWSLSFGGGLDIILANGFAWVMCAADYTRYTTSKKSATVAPMIGATLGFLWFVLIGATGAIAVAVTNGGLFDPYSADLSYICSSLGMGSIANLLIVISTIAVNMINIYSGGFSTANISEKLPPKGSMIGLGILSMLLALTPLVLGSFLDTFQVSWRSVPAVHCGACGGLLSRPRPEVRHHAVQQQKRPLLVQKRHQLDGRYLVGCWCGDLFRGKAPSGRVRFHRTGALQLPCHGHHLLYRRESDL